VRLGGSRNRGIEGYLANITKNLIPLKTDPRFNEWRENEEKVLSILFMF